MTTGNSMFFRCLFILVLLRIRSSCSSCPYIRTSVILTDCVFDTNIYLSVGAHISHSKSIDFFGYYSLNQTESFDHQTLVHNFNDRWMLLVPLILKCANQSIETLFTECQYTMRQSSSSTVEYTSTQLTVMNLNHLGSQAVLFLPPGDITLRSCKAYDCSKETVYLTGSNDTFHVQVIYEKPIGTVCQSNFDCSDRYSLIDLMHCDQRTQTCQCIDEDLATVHVNGIGRLCTDSIDRSNCSKVPQRCLLWCNRTPTSHCICPSGTRKVRKIDSFFDCELEPTDACHVDNDPIRKCPTGTFCEDHRCRPLTVARFNNEPISNSTTTNVLTTLLIDRSLTDTSPRNPNFLYSIIFIVSLIILLFIFILFLIGMLIKSRRSSSFAGKISDSSFIHSISTAISNDSNQDTDRSQTTLSNYLFQNPISFLPGLVPHNSLSPRFYRPYQVFDQRRAPMYIQSPRLSIVHQDQHVSPRLTRLDNGDFQISA